MMNSFAGVNHLDTEKEIREKNIQYEFFALFINTILIVDIFRLGLGNSAMVSLVRNGLYMLGLAYMVYDSMKNKRFSMPIFVFTAYYILITLSNIYYPNISGTIKDGVMIFISRCIPALYFAFYYRDLELLYTKLKKYYAITVVYCLIYSFEHTRLSVEEKTSNYMTFSYNIVFMVTLMLFDMFQKFKLWKFIVAFLGIGVIFMFGSRGALICPLISLFAFLIMGSGQTAKSRKQRRTAIIIAILGTIVVVVWGNKIIEFLYSINPDSRTLRHLLNNKIFDLSGRDNYYSVIWNRLQDNWLLPHGLYSDRAFLLYRFGRASYAHNLLLELWCNFGIISGSLILFYLITVLLRSVRRLSANENTIQSAMYFSFLTGLTTMFLSSSYLVNERFWLWLGIAMALLHKEALKADTLIDDNQYEEV